MKSLVLYFLFFMLNFSTWAQCLFGNGTRVECVYGCDHFTDNDGNGYCDFSRSVSEEKTDTIVVEKTKDVLVQPKRTKESTIPKPVETVQKNRDTTPCISTSEILPNKTDTIAVATPITTKTPFKKSYHLILISALTLGAYFYTFLLSRFGLLQKSYHRRIWNTLLLLTATVSCLFGFFLVIQLNYGLSPDSFRLILTWHVECGIAMTIIAIFHVLWHIPYYKRLFKAVRKKNS